MRATLTAVILLVWVVDTGASPAHACKIATNTPVVPDRDSDDATPPSAIADVSFEVIRGQGGGCDGSSSSCDDIGIIVLFVEPGTDDRDAPALLSYRLVLVSGSLPRGVTLRPGPVALLGDHINLVWIDGASDAQEDFAAVLDIIPVDRAGNEGPPTRVRVADEGAACRAAPLDLPGSLAVALLVLAALALRRAPRDKRSPRC